MMRNGRALLVEVASLRRAREWELDATGAPLTTRAPNSAPLVELPLDPVGFVLSTIDQSIDPSIDQSMSAPQVDLPLDLSTTLRFWGCFMSVAPSKLHAADT